MAHRLQIMKSHEPALEVEMNVYYSRTNTQHTHMYTKIVCYIQTWGFYKECIIFFLFERIHYFIIREQGRRIKLKTRSEWSSCGEIYKENK